MPMDTDAARDAKRRFTKDLAQATSAEAALEALYQLSDCLVPVRLWTVMTVDLEAGLARRAYSNMAEAYPTSGTKPIAHNDWFDLVGGQHKSFVANTLSDIAAVFPDYELIGSLGCGSVMNLPVVDDGTLIATVNLLDAEGHFTPDRIRDCSDALGGPALAALKRARALSGSMPGT